MTTETSAKLYCAEGHTLEAIGLVEKYHYSHRGPANIQLVITWHTEGGLFGDLGEAVAACFFSIPPTRWSEDVWELSRLVRNEELKTPLSKLIGQSVKQIKGRIDLVVSFADWTQGHHGGIYQASSWNYGGMRDSRMDGILLNGRFIPGRTCNSTYGTRSPRLLTAKLGQEVTGHWDDGKYFYWKYLSRTGKQKAERLGLECLPYPKPGRTTK